DPIGRDRPLRLCEKGPIKIPPKPPESPLKSAPKEVWGGVWKRALSKPWDREVPQVILEGRAPGGCLKYCLPSVGKFRATHVVLNDSMAALLALLKGRSSSGQLQRICRLVAALSLCSGRGAARRWVPSGHDSADPASRNRPGLTAEADRAAATDVAGRAAELLVGRGAEGGVAWAGAWSGGRVAAAAGPGVEANRFRREVAPPSARRGERPPSSETPPAPPGPQSRHHPEAKRGPAVRGAGVGVGPSRRDNPRRAISLNLWARRSQLPIETLPQLDEAPAVYFHEQFLKGEESADTWRTFAALSFSGHHLGLKCSSLPRATRAARGWRRLAPPRPRLPLPRAARCQIIRQLVSMSKRALAELTAEGAPLFDVSDSEWNAKFAVAARASGPQPLPLLTLHQLRHGGAGRELLASSRAQDKVQKRGRRVTDQAARRCAEGGRIQEPLNSLPDAIQHPATLEGFSGGGNSSRALRIVIKGIASFELDTVNVLPPTH
ncbi:unnamed protein product, partial [Prorocentrum cordatum]